MKLTRVLHSSGKLQKGLRAGVYKSEVYPSFLTDIPLQFNQEERTEYIKSFRINNIGFATMKFTGTLYFFLALAVASPLLPRAVTEFDVTNFVASCHADNTGCK